MNTTAQYSGLTSDQAKINIIQFGPNVSLEKKPETIATLFIKQLLNPLIYILLIVAVITTIMGDYSDTIVIVFVVMLNAIIGTVQSKKANNVINSLKKLSQSKSKVMRDGILHTLTAEKITIDDSIFLSAGDIIPADGTVLETHNLQINESKITGESMPASKTDPDSIVYKSTVVVSGSGVYRVTAIGKNTMIGEISSGIIDNVNNETILEQKIKSIIHFIMLFVALCVAVIFGIGWLRDIETIVLFKTVVSLAVSAIPEGLPIVITVVLSVGAWRISKARGLLKNLPSGATLATVSFICTDKTGTLTEGDITVKEIIDLHAIDPNELYTYIAASLDIKKVAKEQLGDILDIKLDKYVQTEIEWTETKEKPFTSELKYNAKEYQTNAGIIQIFKGAPEIFINDDAVFSPYAEMGLRVLCIGYKQVQQHSDFDTNDVIPVALVIFEDKMRDDIPSAIADCKNTAVRVMMITGDNILTAKHIARESGILDGTASESCIDNEQLASYNDSELKDIIYNIKVIARAKPLDKLRIVRILQELGEVVAMTGDGVNDGPSIALADIGIAMGITGTEVAKEAADFILVTDSFSNIRDGIFEARIIIENIRKALIYMLSTSLSEIIIIGGSILAGLPIPLLPAQILWLNLITDGFLSIAIAYESGEPQYKQYNYHRYHGNLLQKNDIQRIIVMASVMAIVSLITFVMLLKVYSIGIARTVMLIIMSVFQWMNALNVRKEYMSIIHYNIFNNIFISTALFFEACLLLISIYTPIGHTLLHTVSVEYHLIAWCMVLPISIIICDEVFKYIQRRKNIVVRT